MDNGSELSLRVASVADVPALAAMNERLIRDEGHRNTMDLRQLEQRMETFLREGYKCIMAEVCGELAGYSLFLPCDDFLYIRQLYVAAPFRRRGLGRAMVDWIAETECAELPKLRIDVLVGNEPAIAFWKAIGFHDYCVTMERSRCED